MILITHVQETPKTPSKWLILTVVVMSAFMSALDGSIINVALPRMARDLGATTSSIQTVATSYLIVIVATVLLFGRLADLFGKGRVFNGGLALFTFGSLLCGLSGTLPFLVVSRVVQAVGASALMATNQGLITETFPTSERGKALGFTGTAVALGSLTGPGLGGLIVGAARWEYIFLINIPVGILVLYYGLKLLPKGHRNTEGRLDIPGALLFSLAIVPLFVGLNEGLALGFTHPLILTGFAVSACSFVAFLVYEKRTPHPLVDLSIFKNGLFSLSILCAYITFIAIFCNNIILPFYLQDVHGYAPQQAGMMMMVYPIILMVAAPLSGHLSDRIGSEVLTLLGLLLVSGGLGMMATLGVDSRPAVILTYIAAMSVGMGLFQSPNNSLIMSTVPRHKLGIAGSINALVRNTGMVSGIALATTLLYTMMSQRLGQAVTDYVPGQSQAFLYGMRSVYLTAAAICMTGAVLTLYRYLSGKKKQAAA